ncbi:MAG: hypothetical protein ACOYK9_00020 [Chlamydiia bacterium]
MVLFLIAMLLIQPFQGAIPQEEVLAVGEVVTILSESNLLSLAGKKGQLTEIGKKIEHLHPLDFLKVVAVSKPLLRHLKNIQKSSVKWRAFISGMTRSLNTVSLQKSFPDEVATFAISLEISIAKLQDSIDKKDWEQFVKIVIEEKLR